jgi:cell division protein FtsB
MHKDKQTYLQKTKKQNQTNRKGLYILGGILVAFVLTLSILLFLGK